MSEDCRHIHVLGRRCGSPALRGHTFCYFHARNRTRHIPTKLDNPTHADTLALPAAIPSPALFDFPPIEDRESIMVAASMIVAALGRNTLEPRRAAGMLYALQVATAVTSLDNDGSRDYIIETETLLAPDGSDIASDDAIVASTNDSPPTILNLRAAPRTQRLQSLA